MICTRGTGLTFVIHPDNSILYRDGLYIPHLYRQLLGPPIAHACYGGVEVRGLMAFICKEVYHRRSPWHLRNKHRRNGRLYLRDMISIPVRLQSNTMFIFHALPSISYLLYMLLDYFLDECG